jgi:hypothetical protein
MSFTLSTFTIEINAIPTAAFQAKWQAEAGQICRDWLHIHWEEFSEKGPRGDNLPPIFTLRLARSAERAAYEAEGSGFEFCGEVKVVNLIKVLEHHPREADQSAENVSEQDGIAAVNTHGEREGE